MPKWFFEWHVLSGCKAGACRWLLAALLMVFVAAEVNAGAFSLYGEGNGVNAGDYAAGAAVTATDASTLLYNPAGLSLLEGRQWVLGANLVDAAAKLTSGSSNWQSLILPMPNYLASVAGTRTESLAAVPSFYFASPLSNSWFFGLGVYVSYGLQTNWGDEAETRYAATLSKLNIINISPALSFRLDPQWHIGLGLDLQLAEVDFNAITGLPTIADPTGFDSTVVNHARSTGFGAHVGVLWQVNATVRLGLNYQSKVRHRFNGKSTLTGPLGDPTNNFVSVNPNLSSDPIYMPAQWTLSLLHQATPKLGLMATAVYAQWSTLSQIALHNVATPSGLPSLDVIVPENFRNTWRLAGGLRYQFNDKLLLRAGIGFDQTPTNAGDRNIRLPDSDRFATAIGAHYRFSPKVSADIGWTHFFTKAVLIDNTTNVGGTADILIDARVKSHIDIVGIQLNFTV